MHGAFVFSCPMDAVLLLLALVTERDMHSTLQKRKY